MYAVHNSFLPEFREPFGAVCVSGKVKLSLFTDEECHARLLYWIADEGHMLSMTKERAVYSGIAGFMHYVTLLVPSVPTLIWYMFEMQKEQSINYFCGSHGEGYLCDRPEKSYQITVYKENNLPAWYKNAVVYQIFPDRFARGGGLGGLLRISSHTNIGQRVYIHDSWDDDVLHEALPFEEHYDPCDFFCGDLCGIEENLGYLSDLGITCIYLNPIFASPSNHRYDTADYMAVDGILGGDEAFFSLKRACEEYGIHIMLDGVFSHTGADSRYFNKYGHYPDTGAYQSRESPYYSWYDFSEYPSKYRSWWGFPSLPETDEDDVSFRAHIKSCIDKWGVSWRLDVADELTDDFMYFLHDVVKAKDPEAVIIGEVWEDASNKISKGHRRPYTDGDCLDGVMNYPLRQLLIDFLNMGISADDFCRSILILQENYPPQFLAGCLNITGSHDTERLFTALSCDKNDKNTHQTPVFNEKELTKTEKKVILAISVLFLSDGIPCIYYGDEQGMQGDRDPFCRRPFIRSDERIHRVCRKLAHLNRHSSAFSERMTWIAGGDDILILKRESGGECVLCAVNRSDTEMHMCTIFCRDGIYTDIFTEQIFGATDGRLEISLARLGVYVLLCKDGGGNECLTDDTELTSSAS